MLEILDSDENFDIIPLTHNLDGFDVDKSKLLWGMFEIEANWYGQF